MVCMTKHKHQRPAHDSHGHNQGQYDGHRIESDAGVSNDDQLLEGEEQQESLEVGRDNNEGKGKSTAVSGASHHPIGYENTRMAAEHFDQAI